MKFIKLRIKEIKMIEEKMKKVLPRGRKSKDHFKK